MRHDSGLHHVLSRLQRLVTVGVEAMALLVLLHGHGPLHVDEEVPDLLLRLLCGCLDGAGVFVDDENEGSSDVGALVKGDFDILDFAELLEVKLQLLVGDLGRDAPDEDLLRPLLDGDFLDLELAARERVVLSVVNGQGGGGLFREQDKGEALGVALFVSFDADVRDFAEAGLEVLLQLVFVGGVGELGDENLQLPVILAGFVCHF